jgi:hypothetical protein
VNHRTPKDPNRETQKQTEKQGKSQRKQPITTQFRRQWQIHAGDEDRSRTRLNPTGEIAAEGIAGEKKGKGERQNPAGLDHQVNS